MTGINLAQSVNQQEENSVARKKKAFRGGMYLTIAIIALVLVGWSVLHYQFKKTETEIAGIENEIQAASGNLSSDNVSRVADMQNRLDIISKISKEGVIPFDVLRNMEAVVLPETVFIQYAYDVKASAVSIDAETDSFKTLVSQLSMFRMLDGFQDLSIKSISKTDTAAIAFSVTILFEPKSSTH